MRTITFLVSLSVGCIVCVNAVAAVWYVDKDNVSGVENGTSWTTAFTTIQAAVDAAEIYGEVWVAEGTYVENIAFSGNDITLQSTEPANPDIVAATIIDGNQAGAVVTFAGTETESCVLSGFTITNGQGDEGGGGVKGHGTRATIQNNSITGNSAGGDGGGLACCHGTILNNTITRNSAGNDGGGLARCDAAIENNIIAGNSADYGGGLAWCGGWYGGTICYNTISGNTAVWRGGGLSGCDAYIINCIVWGNEAAVEGAQLYECSVRLYSCIQDGAGWGEGNMSSDPLFMDVGNGDFHLSPSSPCIDAGYPDLHDAEDPSRPGYALYPALGTTRNDMGAYGGLEARELPTAPTESEGIGCFGGAIMSNNTPGGSSNGDALLLTITVAGLLAAASKKHAALSDR